MRDFSTAHFFVYKVRLRTSQPISCPHRILTSPTIVDISGNPASHAASRRHINRNVDDNRVYCPSGRVYCLPYIVQS